MHRIDTPWGKFNVALRGSMPTVDCCIVITKGTIAFAADLDIEIQHN